MMARPPPRTEEAIQSAFSRVLCSVPPPSKSAPRKALTARMASPSRPRPPSKVGKKGGDKAGLDPTMPSLLYFTVYLIVFGKMALTLVQAQALGERFLGS